MDMLREASIQQKPKQTPTSHIYDLVTVGFGTKALALATAIEDYNISTSILFLEQNHSFVEGSHDQDLEVEAHATMQNSFMHDLATLRDPTSQFTFLNYLQTYGKLESFIGLQSEMGESYGFIQPLRDEFCRYLSWAASFFEDYVRYGEEVIEVSKVSKYANSPWRVVSKDTATQDTIVRLARNVVFANSEHMASIASDVISGMPGHSDVEPMPMEMLHVTNAIRGVANRSSDDQFCTLAIHSGEVLNAVFSENRLLLIRAML